MIRRKNDTPTKNDTLYHFSSGYHYSFTEHIIPGIIFRRGIIICPIRAVPWLVVSVWTATSANVPSDMYIQRRFRSVCAFSQPDENLPWAHFGWPRIQNFFMWTRKTQIILHGRAGWSESSLVARQMVRFVTLRFLCPGFRHSNSFLLSLGIRSRRQYPTLTLPERLIICFIIILLLFVYLQADQLTEEQIAGTCLTNNSITIFSYYFPGKHILWYTIEAPRRRASSEYPQHMFYHEIRKY